MDRESTEMNFELRTNHPLRMLQIRLHFIFDDNNQVIDRRGGIFLIILKFHEKLNTLTSSRLVHAPEVATNWIQNENRSALSIGGRP